MSIVEKINQAVTVLKTNLQWKGQKSRHEDLSWRLDQIAASQVKIDEMLSRIIGAQTSTQRLVVEMTEKSSEESEEESQSRYIKWVTAFVALAFSGWLIFWGQGVLINVTTVDSQVIRQYQQSESDRSQALEGILDALPAFDGSVVITATSHKVFPLDEVGSMLKLIRGAQNELNDADNEDSQAYSQAGSTSGDSYLATIGVTLGSIIAGCAGGWIVTQRFPRQRMWSGHKGPGKAHDR